MHIFRLHGKFENWLVIVCACAIYNNNMCNAPTIFINAKWPMLMLPYMCIVYATMVANLVMDKMNSMHDAHCTLKSYAN